MNKFVLAVCSIVGWAGMGLLKIYLPPIAPRNPFFLYLVYCLVAVTSMVQSFIVLTAIGNVIKNGVHGSPVALKAKPWALPRLRIVVVTWGTRPDLVNELMRRNVGLFIDVGFREIHFEVYSNRRRVDLVQVDGITQNSVLVPPDYEAPFGLVGKARSLAYAQAAVRDQGQQGFTPYVLVLDQDVRLTACGVAGILNFMADGTRDFANGYSYIFANRKLPSKIVALMHDFSYTVAHNSSEFLIKQLRWRYPHTSTGGYQVYKVDVFCNIPYGNEVTRGLGEDIYFDYTASKNGCQNWFLDGFAMRGTPANYFENLQQKERWARCMVLIVASTDLPALARLVQLAAMSSWYLGGWVFLWMIAYPEINNTIIVPVCLCLMLAGSLGIHVLEARKIEGIGFQEMLLRVLICCSTVPVWSMQMTFGTTVRVLHKFLTCQFYAWPEKRS